MSTLELAQELISIKSISPEDKGCFKILDKKVTELGFRVLHGVRRHPVRARRRGY